MNYALRWPVLASLLLALAGCGGGGGDAPGAPAGLGGGGGGGGAPPGGTISIVLNWTQGVGAVTNNIRASNTSGDFSGGVLINIPAATTFTLTSINAAGVVPTVGTAATVFIVVTALNAGGDESAFSNELICVITAGGVVTCT